MHVLTKIFIVLVALLAVMLVPLVVVYAKNEGSFKTKFTEAETARAAAEKALESANLSYARQIESKEGELQALNQTITGLRKELEEKSLAVASLESDLALTESRLSQFNSQLQLLASTGQASQSLTNELVNQSSALRSENLQLTRRGAELENRFREVDREREVLDAAVRSLKEEVQRLSEAQGEAMTTVAMYQSKFGDLGTVAMSSFGVPIDTKIIANVVEVAQSNGSYLVEIDAGERDGVKKDWVMTLGDGRGNYLGRLRIVEVDVNRSIGMAETASGQPATNVNIGAKAYAIPAN